MNFDLVTSLPLLKPKAAAWVQEQEALILASGKGLTDYGLDLARRVGVVDANRIRILLVADIPRPTEPLLIQAMERTGMLGPDMNGVTLGHGIYIRESKNSVRLLTHEFRHVHQYEVAGSIASYIPAYLEQIVQFGYWDAPFEVDARSHEIVA
ncbi:MAG: hypothetical protein V4542_00530 [Pseudomonadota bacterium]